MSVFKKHLIDKQIDESLRDNPMPRQDHKDGDFVIAVMDRGWVFVGFITNLPNERIRLDCCYNIHHWGTDKGLGQLAVYGPREETKLYEAGVIYGKPIFIMSADIDKW
jgi:hypothetical protein